LFDSLVNNHAFVDGNKRAAFASVQTFRLVGGFDLDVSSKSAFDFMIETLIS
jgi:prophage maintenance system killer protein